MPRFVLLYHECPPEYVRHSHWDFMLEVGDALRTWAVAELPAAWSTARLATAELGLNCASAANGNEVEAERLGEHRREYLDYEGPVSGGRGHVVRIDRGDYMTISESPHSWTLALTGRCLRGTVELRQISPNSALWVVRCGPG